jgi:hypothetical protein
MKLLRNLIRNHGDALRVRILVALEFIGCLRELYESLSRRAIDQLCLDCHHFYSHKKAQKSQKRKPCRGVCVWKLNHSVPFVPFRG